MSRNPKSSPPAPPSPFLHRGLEARLREALTATPVVCLLGPRRSGKSTLAASLDPDRLYVSLDDADYLNLAMEDPRGFLAELPDQVTIDEVQRAPALSLTLCEKGPGPRSGHDTDAGLFVVTASAVCGWSGGWATGGGFLRTSRRILHPRNIPEGVNASLRTAAPGNSMVFGGCTLFEQGRA
jgi:hypothetical protein